MSRVILDLCGGSGAWSKPYSDAGYDVRLVTLPEHDVRLYSPPEGVHGVLAAPPCTALAASGARWWSQKGPQALLDALAVVDACLRVVLLARPTWWVLENPVGRLVHYLGKPTAYVQPYNYGDPWTKKTCLWGTFQAPAWSPVEPMLKSPIHYASQSAGRGAMRSITPPGFAQAFFEANQ